MQLKKSKRLAQKQITKVLNNIIKIVEDLDKVRNNEQLQERLKEIKHDSDELIKYFIDNCKKEAEKIQQHNERNYIKRPSLIEVMRDESDR